MKAIISKETLWHFQCPGCEQWWTIGDYKGGAAIYCPRCHQRLEVEEEKEGTANEPSASWVMPPEPSPPPKLKNDRPRG